MIWCLLCDHRLTGRRRWRNYRAYQCSHIDPFTHKRLCPARQISCAVLDNGLYDELVKQLSDEKTVRTMIRDYYDAQAKARPKLGPSAEDRIAKLKRDEIAQGRILGDGDLLDKWAPAKKRKLETQVEIRMLERERAEAAKVRPLPSSEDIRVYWRGLAKARNWTDYGRRRELVERTVTKARYANGEYEIEGRIFFGVQNRNSCLDADA